MHTVSLFTALLLFWLALSGHFKPFLVTAGIVCAAVCVLAARRMGAADAEGHPYRLLRRVVTYYPWLIREICKADWAVTRIILDPRLPISPTMTRVTASQRTSVGIATYANSITLTPGTITTAVDGTVLTIHALTREGADDVEAGGMNARVRQFEGAV